MRKIVFAAISFIFAAVIFSACSRVQVDTSSFKEGDIIFQNNKAKSKDLLAFLSNTTYNNAGILFVKNGRWYVLDAAKSVQLTPLKKWVKEGVDHSFVVKRLKDGMSQEAVEKMRSLSAEYLGKPYDQKYEWSDKAFYSSELVWKMFDAALGVKLSDLRTFSEFNFSDENVKRAMQEVFGNDIPVYEQIVTPADIYNSNMLEIIVQK